MKIRVIGILYLIAMFACNQTHAQKIVTSYDEFIDYAISKSLTLKNGDIRYSQAKNAKLAALLGTIDPTGTISSKYTNNTRLPVSLFPSELLGGQPGTYQEVKLGIQYQTDINSYLDLKLINLSGWENLKLSKINIDVTSLQNKLTLKNLQEDIALIYYNILTLQEQLSSLELNLLSSDSLYQSTLSKYKEGLSKQQDVNDARLNKLNLENSRLRVINEIYQGYSALKVLCDIPENEEIQIKQAHNLELPNKNVAIEVNSLVLNHAIHREQFAMAEYRKSKYSNFPTLSFFASDLRQQYNTQAIIFDNNANWIHSNFFGVKISFNLPSSQAIAQTSKTKSDYIIARNNTEQAKTKSRIAFEQLQHDLEIALQQRNLNLDVYNLSSDTYKKNLLNYKEGIISLDQTIRSFNTMVNNQFNLISSTLNLQYVRTKIEINNKLR